MLQNFSEVCLGAETSSVVPLSLNARLLNAAASLPWTQQCVSPPRGRLESSSRVSFKVKFAQAPTWPVCDVGLSKCTRGKGVGLWRECDRRGVLFCHVCDELRLEGVVTLVHALPVFIWIPPCDACQCHATSVLALYIGHQCCSPFVHSATPLLCIGSL